MATIKLCDWTKKRLASNEQTYTLTLNGREFEVCKDALLEIQGRLEGEEIYGTTPLIPPAPTPRPRPVTPIAQQTQEVPEDDIGVNVEAPSPFGRPEPGLLDPVFTNPVAPIAIPASTKERLPTPTPAQADAVVAESKRFQEGTLSALTPGKTRTLAQQKLAAKESSLETSLKREKEKLS